MLEVKGDTGDELNGSSGCCQWDGLHFLEHEDEEETREEGEEHVVDSEQGGELVSGSGPAWSACFGLCKRASDDESTRFEEKPGPGKTPTS